ncbi:efflux transporter, RND family, MFP subunit [Pseudodesulfovibrio mercurii]|uniref:Efflux transporter, RND family, MFP subunit n=1 Tax=Pseudodesulfovibrio mercurii TaxID=641491 RepID=F0JIM3_9BACT|nr:efflux RND transporter periplasmic adaptor subunit [Pseudodesulfovibrio mercurii]EGB15457.1 efflux transporter, RND family, MFP subunit [Pseudodesulfovibrio mercurii]
MKRIGHFLPASLPVLLTALLSALLLTAGCGNDRLGETDSGKTVVPGSALAEAAQAEVPTPAPAETGSTETFTVRSADRKSSLTGFTRARNAMSLVAEESGRVVKVLADVGDALGPDGLFAELDTTFIELDLAANRADQARLKSDLAYNKKELDRYQALVKTDTAPQSTLDANVRAHQAALQQLRAKQVEEQVLLERLERFSLVGPPGWKVVARDIEPGEWVTKGETVAQLGRYDVLLVPFALTSEEYRALKALGDEVALRLTDLGGTVEARVARVSPGFDPVTRKINVDLEIARGDFEFRGGIRTELDLALPDPGGAVVVPESALVKAYEEYFLMTPDHQRVRVVLLGSAGDGLRRVSGPDVRPGAVYLLHP